jgi:thioredoxin-like negative regulator of GroEL
VERLTAADFEGVRLLRAGDWAVCFAADWCSFCQSFRKFFDPLEGRESFRVAIGDLTDTESSLWETFTIEVVPTLIAFRNGLTIQRWNGILGSGLKSGDIQALRDAFEPADRSHAA